MKILTVSASPYLSTKLGKINSYVLECLSEMPDVEVSSAVWHHDISWYSASEDGQFFFEKNDKKICRIYPFINRVDMSSPQVYEIMKKAQPDVVISIGDYHETDFIFAIKSLHPTLFKWINILTIDAVPINDSRKDSFQYMDYILSSTKEGAKEVSEFCNTLCEYVPIGIDHDVFNIKDNIIKNSNKLKIFGCGKNSQSSGSATYMMGVASARDRNENIESYMHTNISDEGDYDLYYLKERYDKHNAIALPEEFIGINEGIEEKALVEKLNGCDVVADLSVRAATGMSVLEGMACGCIPVATKVGALKEIIEEMPEAYQFFVDSNVYVGALAEHYEVASYKSFADILLELENIKKRKPEVFQEIKSCSVKVSKKFELRNFLRKIKDVIKVVRNNKNELNLEIFE
jgi:glycosyltransferase involved in cell wall biosynthesis